MSFSSDRQTFQQTGADVSRGSNQFDSFRNSFQFIKPIVTMDINTLRVPNVHVEMPKQLQLQSCRIIARFYNKQTVKLVYEESSQNVSLSTTRVRQRLCDLMGTDVIRLNDRRYFEKLSQRLQEEYETMMDKHEDARAQSEQQRQRRLMLEGVIDAPDDYRTLIHGEHKRKAKKKRQMSRARSAAAAQYRSGSDDAHVTSRDSEDEHEQHAQKEEVITQIEMLTHTSTRQTSKSQQPTVRIQLRPKSSENENQESSQDDKSKLVNDMLVRPPHHDGAARSPSPVSTYQNKRGNSASARLSHWDNASISDSDDEERPHTRESRKAFKNESPLIKSLRQEETVDGLYSIAAKLISPIKTEEVSRKVAIAKPKKIAFKLL